MSQFNRTVFISYRHDVSWQTARLVSEDLQRHGFDVFVDIESLNSGDFEREILAQISARRHFIVILERHSLDHVADPNDWLRREVSHAIRQRRNVVPLIAQDFRLDPEALPEEIGLLADLNAVELHRIYFPAAMERLRKHFLLSAKLQESPPTANRDTKVRPTRARWPVSEAKLLPFYLALDASRSMTGPKLAAANRMLPQIHDALARNPALADKVRIALIDFAEDARIRLQLCDILDTQLILPSLSARGSRYYSVAFDALREEIDSNILQLQYDGFQVHRPAVLFISDGPPEDDPAVWKASFLRLINSARYPNFIPFGVDRADPDVMRQLIHPPSGPTAMKLWNSRDAGLIISEMAQILISDILIPPWESDDPKASGILLPDDDFI